MSCVVRGSALVKFFLPVLVPVRASPVPKERKKENRQPKGGIKERKKTDNPREGWEDGTPPPHRDFKERSPVRKKERKHTTQGSPVPSVVRKILFPTCIPGRPPGVYL